MQALHLEPWGRFIEQVPGADLVTLYNGALLLAMPSFYEGFGLPALEALQCSTPVVVADRASLPEVVGVAGLLIDPDDPTTITEACWRIAHDAILRVCLQVEGQEQVRAFTWEETARWTLEVYRRVLNR